VVWRHKGAETIRRQIIFLPYLLPLRCCVKTTHTNKRPATQWHRNRATAPSTTKTTAQSGKHNYRSVAWGFRALAGHEKYFALLQADFSDFSTSNPEQGPTFRPRATPRPYNPPAVWLTPFFGRHSHVVKAFSKPCGLLIDTYTAPSQKMLPCRKDSAAMHFLPLTHSCIQTRT